MLLRELSLLTVLLCLLTTITWAEISLNDYSHRRFPGRCVIKLKDDRVLYMKASEKFKFPNRPCSFIRCLFDGWALRYSCDVLDKPNDCVYEYVKLNETYPLCCEREMRCINTNNFNQN